jgi:predicted phosphodiesterase
VKIAVISDIHGNLEALSSVVLDIRSRGVERIVCLGDVVGYGPNPNECIELVESECDYSLVGNHEAAIFDALIIQEFNDYARYAIEWTRDNLNSKSLNFINSLPIMMVDDVFTAVHATPYEPQLWYYIASMDDALFNFNFFKTKFCLIGHTHVPGIIAMGSPESNISILPQKTLCYAKEFSEKARFIVNVGSVGQPRDKNSKACYVIIDTDKKELSFLRISYDVALYQRKMHAIGMPDFLVNRVADGC